MNVRDSKAQTVLRIDLANGSTQRETLSEEWTRKYLGCRGITTRMLYDEVKTGTDPFGPDNVLFIGTGPMDGLPVGMGRTSMACKSPRGSIAEGSAGGFFGPELRRAGIDYLAIRGKADHPVYLYIEDGAVEIRDADHLWGLTTYETDAVLRTEIKDPNTQLRYIGPAGENLVHSAPIFGNLNQSGGRAGCGEVMGSKKLKAIAVRGHQGIAPADYKAFVDAYKAFRYKLDVKTSRDMWIPVWNVFGAPVLSRLFTDMGNLMTKNAQQMRWESDKAEAISCENHLDRQVTKSKACWCCPAPSCQKMYRIPSGKHQGFKGGNYWAGQPLTFGSLIDNSDLDLLLVLSGLCNQYGLDIFHVGYTLCWAMECYERGLLKKSDTDGLDLKFGCNDQDGLIDLIRKIAMKEGFGELLAMGCWEASKQVGKGSEKFCLSVKGQELEGIAERNMLMVGLGVAVSEVGPDHTRWYPPYPCNPSLISKEELSKLGIDLDLGLAFQTRNPEQKGELLRWFTISRAVVEALPSCVFLIRDTLGLDMRPWHDLFTAATGIEMDYAEFVRCGERLMNLDRVFNVREGYRRKDDHPPYRMAHEDVPYFGYAKLEPALFDPMLDEYYEANGWSVRTSIPTRKKLEELGFKDIADDLQSLGIEAE
jgi:aldehyde:ferredoxin oxidoreductase